MKKNKKMVATLLVFALTLLASIGGMNVFAQNDSAATLDATAEKTTVVSGCDLSADKLSAVQVKQYGFSMQVPEGTVISLESDASVFAQSDYTRSYFMEQGCILYTFTPNQNYCAVSVFVTDLDSIYNYYGDYSQLTDEQKAELVAAAGGDDNTVAEFVTINGRTYLQVTMSDNDVSTGNKYVQYQFTTVIGSQRYVIYIQTANAIDSDKAVINTMISSIVLSGLASDNVVASMSKLEIALVVLCVILVIAVALIYFFFYRANQFVKAGITDYKRLGFDLPEKEVDEDDIYDEDEDVDDFDDDEDVEEDDVEEDDVEDVEEDDDNDERIIKD